MKYVDRHSPERNHWVYRAYDRDGVLLYVGCTKNLAQRKKVHRSESKWFRYACRFRLVGPYCYQDARQVEREALAAEAPVFGNTPQKQSLRYRRHWAASRAAASCNSTDMDTVMAAYYQGEREFDANNDLTLLRIDRDYMDRQEAAA